MTKKPEPKIPARRQLRYRIEAIFAHFLYGIFWAMPLDWASATGGFILKTIGPHLATSRKALRNIELAFPEKTPQEHGEILAGMWDNLGRVIAEYPHLHRIWDRVELVGGEYLEQMRDDDAPSIIFAGHLANWEIQAIGAKQTGLPLTLIYRKPNNPWVDRLLRHARNSGASGHITKGLEGMREMVRVLKQNGNLGVLIDQKLNEGIPVPFFGRDAMTTPAMAQLAMKFDCPMVPAQMERLGRARFRLTIYPPFKIAKSGDNTADALKTMTHINRLVETWVRQNPEQWLWLHRRWPEDV